MLGMGKSSQTRVLLKRHNRNLISLGLKDEDFLVQKILRLDITGNDITHKAGNAKQVLKRKAAKSNQQQSETPK